MHCTTSCYSCTSRAGPGVNNNMLALPAAGQNDLKREEKHEKSVSDIVVSFFKAENMVFLSNREGTNIAAMKRFAHSTMSFISHILLYIYLTVP